MSPAGGPDTASGTPGGEACSPRAPGTLPAGRPWLPSEVARLRAHFEAGRTPRGVYQSGEFPGRSHAAIRSVAERRGINWPSPHWSAAEVARLRKALAAGRTFRELADSGEFPGRSEQAIRCAARTRELYRPVRRFVGGARQISVYLPLRMVAWLDMQPGTTRSGLAREAIGRMMVG